MKKVFGKAVLTDSKQFNSYYVEDGDYWKIDNIVLGYNFKKDFIKGIKGMRLYFLCSKRFDHYRIQRT